MSMDNFVQISYDRHENHFKDYTIGGKRENHAKTWLKEDTVDAWRLKRMYTLVDPLFACYPNSTWLTVGDARYGKDAHYIQQKGLRVLPTDISDHLLKEAAQIGYISNYKKENAECLSFPNNEFDFVFCKESFHHFPRPMIALYEMLRVSRKGVVLLEPCDSNQNIPSISELFKIKIINGLKLVAPLKSKSDDNNNFREEQGNYEVVGNYVYTISKREIIKVALGLNFDMIAFKGFNDHYIENIEYENVSDNTESFKIIKDRIDKQDILCKKGLASYSLLVTIIFKESPTEKCKKQLIENNYEVIKLSKNPYINKNTS